MRKNVNEQDVIYKRPIILILIGVLAIIMGAVIFIPVRSYVSVTRDEAVSYTGKFDRFEYNEDGDYYEVYFSDDSLYYMTTSDEAIELANNKDVLEKGSQLQILINPKTDYVLEIKTDDEELLSFDSTLESLRSEGAAISVFAIVVIGMGVFLLVIARLVTVNIRKDDERFEAKKYQSNGDSVVLRYADYDVKSRTLLEANVDGYEICYRRVKSVNELVINGRVYDEKKAVLEFEHTLSAVVGGHAIEAGFDGDCHSYITFDGELIERKLRLI